MNSKKDKWSLLKAFYQEMKLSPSELQACRAFISRYRYLVFSLCILIGLNLSYRVGHAIYLRVQQAKIDVQAVFVTHPRHVALFDEYVLPGTLTAWHEAPIYSRIPGYLKAWYVDMGDKLKKGQVMAIIEAPELEAEYRQAKANYHALEAQNKIAQITANRWQAMLREKAISPQEADEKVNAAKKTYADMLAAKAQMHRLATMHAFREIKAPFSGYVSLRNVDIGMLVNAGSQTNSQLPLFKMVQSHKLRLQLKVPQAYIKKLDANIVVIFEFDQLPGQFFRGKLLHVASAIDPLTRTLLAEFMVDNTNHQLLPGIYAHVHFKIPSEKTSVRIPMNALLFRTEGLQVATVDKNDKVLLKEVSIYRDLGNEVEINYGLNLDDRLILNPYDDIDNGQVVRVRASTTTA
jgi:RND family efflux transporter MFP subunit